MKNKSKNTAPAAVQPKEASGLYIILCIIPRERSEDYISFFKAEGAGCVFGMLARGTASRDMLDALGIEKTGRALLMTFASPETTARVMRAVLSKMRINAPGGGVCLSVPVKSIGGGTALSYFSGGSISSIKKGEPFMQEMKYSLIVAVTEAGGTDSVMAAAKQAGARGGTVLHAKGTGAEYQKKFFGVSIAEEKEMVYIVAREEERTAIMRSIMSVAPPGAPGGALVFSLPVEAIAGFSGIEEPENTPPTAENASD